MREMMRDPPSIQTVFATNLKRREKELERKLQENEKKMAEERKTMQRLQSLNKDLMSKFKESQERESEYRGKIDKAYLKEARASNLIEENHQLNIINHELHQRIDFLQEELNKMHSNYNALLATSIEFEEKSQELYRLNQALNNKLQVLVKNNG
jgi:chromosome segregation ATPase